MTSVYFPFLPPVTPYLLPRQPFEKLITHLGQRIQWFRSHSCACVYGGQQPGSADPTCITCRGRGVYWDTPSASFQGLITFIHTSPTPDEPGTQMDTNQGAITNGEPALTIPFTSNDTTPTVWQEAGINDLFVEIDAINRMQAQLQQGVNEVVPYPQVLSIAPTGAVTVWDPTSSAVVTGVAYAVSGTTVTLTSTGQYPTGTNFIVSLMAAPAYVAYRLAGAPAHVRPFASIMHPRRFRLQLLDLWLRQQAVPDVPVIASGG